MYSQRSILKIPFPVPQRATSWCRHYRKKHFQETETSLSFIDPRSLCQQTHYLTLRQSSRRRKTRCCQAVVLMERDLRCFVNTADKSMDGWEEAGHPRGVSEERVVSVTPQKEQDNRFWHTLRCLLNKYIEKQRITSLYTYHWSRSISWPLTTNLSQSHCAHVTRDKACFMWCVFLVHFQGERDGRCQNGGWTTCKACAIYQNVW